MDELELKTSRGPMQLLMDRFHSMSVPQSERTLVAEQAKRSRGLLLYIVEPSETLNTVPVCLESVKGWHRTIVNLSIKSCPGYPLGFAKKHALVLPH